MRSGTACCGVLADIARVNLRSTDLIGRKGGEEFAAVLDNFGPIEAAALAERIRMAFADAAAGVDGRPVAATVSIGLAIGHMQAVDLSALLAQADQALYLSKSRGRNRVELARSDGGP